MERGLPRRLRRHWRRLRGAAADPAAQRQLVLVRQVGARRQGRLRALLPAQDPPGQERDLLREAGPRHARNQQAQGNPRGGGLKAISVIPQEVSMSIDRAVLVFAGFMVLLSVALVYWV